jgi:serine/threonine-protein kinase
MTNVLELDDLKAAWQSLDRKLDLQNTLLLDQAHERRFRTLGRRLLPLRVGQALQMVFGVALILPAVSVWSSLRDGSVLFWAAIFMHVYGAVLIMLGAIMHGVLRQFDPGEPVLDSQKRLARARRFYVIAGLAAGLPWWFLWIPFGLVVISATTGIDAYARASQEFNWMFTACFAGFLLTLGGYRWAMRRPQWAARIERSAAGRSLNRAKAALEELEAFERD